ncbi:MAG: hypothetical protein Q9200_006084 [Gallowayella weberi]
MAINNPPDRLANPSIGSKKRKRDGENQPRKHPKSSKAVGVDALPWNQVSLPDRLDNAEGFFGLEEISDVEIVKDEKLGRVEYRRLKPTDAGYPNGPTVEDDEWTGFGDSDFDEKPGSSHPQTKSSEQDPVTKNSLKKREKNPRVEGPGELSEANGFEILEDESGQEADGEKSCSTAHREALAKLLTVSAWHHLGLSSQVLGSLAKLHFTTPTKIQSLAIPEILSGQNVIGKASTGSGKTLAFGIPIVEYYLERGIRTDHKRRRRIEEREDPPAALIISPTRELARQLSEHLEVLCSNIVSNPPTVATLTGGLSMQKQQRVLANANIIIGTPGRLWETMSSSKGLMPWLKQIKYLVLDEADRLLTEGHFQEVEDILDALNKTNPSDDQPSSPSTQEAPLLFPTRQTLIFSATFSPTLNHKLSGRQKASATDSDSLEPLLSRLKFHSPPKFIDASPTSNLPTSLTSYVISCRALEKDLYLYALLLTHFPAARTLVFVNDIYAVRRLVPFLQNLDLQVYGLHGDMPQKARMKSVERFSSTPPKSEDGKTKGKASILIASDVAARGLDIPSVQAVILYHLPRKANEYVHRTGRTARRGTAGTSVLLCSPDEVQGLKQLVKTLGEPGPQTLELDRGIVARLKARTTLAKNIAEAETTNRKSAHDDRWLKETAEILGVEFDPKDFADDSSAGVKKKKGKKNGMGKSEIAARKMELKKLLGKRVNVGVSERYLSASGMDVEVLLGKGDEGGFLGLL